MQRKKQSKIDKLIRERLAYLAMKNGDILRYYFNKWLKWAEDTNPRTGEPHILPILVDFLKENQNVWYNISMRNKNSEDEAFVILCQ